MPNKPFPAFIVFLTLNFPGFLFPHDFFTPFFPRPLLLFLNLPQFLIFILEENLGFPWYLTQLWLYTGSRSNWSVLFRPHPEPSTDYTGTREISIQSEIFSW